MRSDLWNPAQYGKFRHERLQPAIDLMSLIQPRPGMQVIDLGCGTGEVTAILAGQLPEAEVLGIDSSAAMLAKAAPRARERLRFERRTIEAATDLSRYDLVFANAALQWVPDHETLFPSLLAQLRPGAQIAIQMPKNEGHPSHRVAAEIAAMPPFRDWLAGMAHVNETLSLERYVELGDAHGLTVVAFEKVYAHHLSSSAEVLEWVKGTRLTAYLSRLDEARSQAFLDAYQERLLAAIGQQAPYLYTFRRLLLWAGRQE